MKYLIFFLFIFSSLFLFQGPLNAQLGYEISYHSNKFTIPENIEGLKVSSLRHLGIGIDYKFKYPNYRIYYGPVISFQSYNRSYTDINNWLEIKVAEKNKFYSFGMRISLYPLNIQGDCNCPTFTRENPFFKRGFFLIIIPGFSLINHRIKTTISGHPSEVNNAFIHPFQLAGGMGLDIGLSDQWTITPEILLNKSWTSSKEKNEFNNIFATSLYPIADIRIEYRIKRNSWN